jgi:hypothetical protein
VGRSRRLWVRFWGWRLLICTCLMAGRWGWGLEVTVLYDLHNSHPLSSSSSSSKPRIEDPYYEIVPLANFEHQRALKLIGRMQLQRVGTNSSRDSLTNLNT